MFRIKTAVLSMFFAVFLVCSAPLSVMAETGSNVGQLDPVYGQVNMNLSQDGSKIVDHLQNASLNLDNVSFANNILRLKGIVTYNNSSHSFDIQSSLHKSITSPSTIVGDSIDVSSNFEVPNFSITTNVDPNKLLISPSLKNTDVIQIYLLREGTRELSMFEIPTSSIPEISANLENIFNTSEVIQDPTKDQWWVTLFKPVVQTTSDSSNPIIEKLLVTPLSLHNDSDTQTYTYYNGPGNVYKYEIKLQAYSNVYDYDGNTIVQTDSFGMKVVSQRYWYNGTLMPNYNFIYVFNTTGTGVLTSSASTTNKDFITVVDWGDTHTSKTGGWTISTPTLTIGTLISSSISWSPTSTVVSETGPKVFNAADKLSGVKVPYIHALNAPNDQYSLTFTKNKVSPSTQQKTSGVVFSYSLNFSASTSGLLGTGQLTVANSYY